ncbi:diaminopimelate epimerase [Lactobacillus sp.]|uniref:diaminopimelate epimerase n=1 Tax=Lactobacillus sp. TaxID=1591 RepID=UPI0025F01966|nr:diaminopimelate epimerase [Lactobacillus sp.]MCO6531549.1 diaminopimelate epimerase [Lactobacillus sp.]
MVYMQKVHGSQNTFFLLDQTQLKQTLSQAELVRLAKQLTNAKTGLLGGADGLLVVSSSSHQNVLGKMQVINADGSIASMCGNGLRTVGRYLAEKYHQNSFKVETQQADLKVSVEPDWAESVKAISVEISPVSFAKQDLPFAQLNCNQLINQEVPAFAPGLKFTAVAVPNPHLISIVSAEVLASSLLEKLGTKLNQPNPYFPDGVNVSFAQVIDSRHLFVRTFERGVGFTNACGTGMSAASLVFALTHQQEKVFNHLLTVSNPGGFVQTRVHQQEDHYWIELIGNATVTHNINADESLFHQDLPDFSLFQVEQTSENAAYQAFISNNK